MKKKCSKCNIELDKNEFREQIYRNYQLRSECKECEAKQKKKIRQNNVDNGLCSECGKYSIFMWNRCEECYFKDCARKNLNDKNAWQYIKDLIIKQNYKCYYSGRNLTSENMSIDHTKPRKTHPELISDINNIKWVDKEVNVAKHSLSEEKFKKLIKDCYNFLFEKEN